MTTTLNYVASSAPEALGVVKRHGSETTTSTRRVDYEFVRAKRDAGAPDSAIARMGGWCVADVRAVYDARAFPLPANKAPKPPPVPTPPLVAMNIPDVVEILRHIAQQYLVTIDDILGHSHEQEYVEPRHEAYAVVWELNRYSAWQLAQIFNKTVPGITYGLERHYERLRERGPGRDW